MGNSKSRVQDYSGITSITTQQIKIYIKSLDVYYKEYNNNPITTQQAEHLSSDPTKILYFWLYLNKWQKLNYEKNKTQILSDIHDMWALNLFVDQIIQDNKIILLYKQSTQTDKILEHFTHITFTANQQPQHEQWYDGDLVSCLYKNQEIKHNKLNDEDVKKWKITFPSPQFDQTIILEFRRIPQLIPFNLLTVPCKKQDEPFWHGNIKNFRSIATTKSSCCW